jgi:hypothetical protein
MLVISVSHFIVKYGWPILLCQAALIFLCRFFGSPRRLRFGLRTALGAVAVFSVGLALLDARLLAPYRTEQRAAAALRRLGGKVVLVDDAPKWLRGYVGEDRLNLSVVSVVDLSHTPVTDADLIHFRAFHHCRQINLSDTQVSNAGLAHLSQTTRQAVGRWLDLSRTRVTDVSVLFGEMSFDQPERLNLSGNRIARVEIPRRRWCPLQELDLSDTDADDRTLESLPDGLVNLFHLDLCGTNVSDDGLWSLLRMESLERLTLIDTNVTPAGVARLKSRWRGKKPPTVLTGATKGAGSASKNCSSRSLLGISAQ